MSLCIEYSDQIPPCVGAAQEPCIFPPFTSATDKPVNTGHKQSASSNFWLLPFTLMVFPVGVQMDAAQRAYWPRQNRKSVICWAATTVSAVRESSVSSNTKPMRVFILFTPEIEIVQRDTATDRCVD